MNACSCATLTPFFAAISANVSPGRTIQYGGGLRTDGGSNRLLCADQTDGDCSSPSAILREGSRFYSAAAHLQVCVLADSGHDLNLALDRGRAETDTIAWTERYLRRSPGVLGEAGPLPGNCR